MRLKHSNKKHKIITLAAEKISQQNTFNIFNDTNAHVGQQGIDIKENLQKSQQLNINMENSLKSSFKECKIREFIDVNNHSPTNSDVQYLDTMQHYKNYLKKSKKLKLKKNKSKQKLTISTVKKTNVTNQQKKQCIFQKLSQKQAAETRQKLKIIQQKINQVKNLTVKYNSQQQFQNIHEQIYQTKTEQSDIFQNEHFQLVSLRDYMKSVDKYQLSSKRQNDFYQSKSMQRKLTTKRPVSHEAKRWYQPKKSHTQREIDPEGLIRKINLDNWKPKQIEKSSSQINDLKLFKKCRSFTSQKYQDNNQHNYEKTNDIKGNKIRPHTAPFKKRENKALFDQKLNNQLKVKLNSQQCSKKFPVSQLYLRQKVKGIRHVERQKYEWNELKKQLQKQNTKQNARKRHKTQLIFQYPWDKRANSFSTPVHYQSNY